MRALGILAYVYQPANSKERRGKLVEKLGMSLIMLLEEFSYIQLLLDHKKFNAPYFNCLNN